MASNSAQESSYSAELSHSPARSSVGKGAVKFGFALEVRRKQAPTVLVSASHEPPSHGQASTWSWQ